MEKQPKGSYLIKLLVLLVKRSGGAIRIGAQDLYDEDIGHGIQVHFDHSAKELVISYIPPGAQTYKVEESITWINNSLIPSSQQVSQTRQLTREDLLEKIYVGRETPDPLPQSREQSREQENKPRVVVLTDESLAHAESERRKRQVLKELEESQPTTIRSSVPRASGFSKP